MILRTDVIIDALVTDLTMPGVDGIALIHQARQLRHDLPAILLTGYADHVASMSTIGGGDFQVMRKPVGCNRLIGQIELLLRKPANG